MIMFGTLAVYGFMMAKSPLKLLARFKLNFAGMILI